MTAQLTRIKGTAPGDRGRGNQPGPGRHRQEPRAAQDRAPLYMSHGVASPNSSSWPAPENAEGILLPAGRLIAEGQVPGRSSQKAILSNYINGYESRFSSRRRPSGAMPGTPSCCGAGRQRRPVPRARRHPGCSRGDPRFWGRRVSTISRPRPQRPDGGGVRHGADHQRETGSCSASHGVAVGSAAVRDLRRDPGRHLWAAASGSR